MKVEVKLLENEKGEKLGKIPFYATPGAAGCDLYSIEDVKLEPLMPLMVHTGIAMAIPEEYEVQIRPRSGLALKDGITVLNAPGTIDSDYRGEVCVILCWTGADTTLNQFNIGTEADTGKRYIYVPAGTRIAQAVLAPVVKARFKEVDELSETERGAGGFNSTGVK